MRRVLNVLPFSALAAVAVMAMVMPTSAEAQSRQRGGQGQQAGGQDEQAAPRARAPRMGSLRSRPNAGPCPYVKVLYDAARYVELADNHAAVANVGYTGEIQGLSSGCAYSGDQPITVNFDVLFNLGRGPQATGNQHTYRYWVAVTERNTAVLAKEYFDLPVDFKGAQTASVTQRESVTIPRKDIGVSGSNFEVLIGFEVTQEMAEFNRTGSRFRVNAGSTTPPPAAPAATTPPRQLMTDLKADLGEAVGAAFAAEGVDAKLARVTPSDRPDLADFQSNGALAAAKALKANPRELAGRVAERLAADPRLSAVEVAGPGFINFKVSNETLAARAQAVADDSVLAGASAVADPRKVVIDYAGPNVAKPMHVGHLRSSIIGESLKRLFRFRGDTVWGDAHFGDWGFQMGLLIVAVGDEGKADEFLVEGNGPFPDVSPVSLEDLERLYPAAAAQAKEDVAFRDRARKATAELQAGRAGYRALWKHFVAVSRTALEREFGALDVTFDLWNGESDADPRMAGMVADLTAKGLLVEDAGAQVVHVARPGETRKKKLADGSVIEAPSPPPLLVISSEGSAMYGTTDLATIVDRREAIDPDLILYVVDERQAEHFEQVFRAAYLAGYAKAGELEHLGFGTMNGTDGKPFKTRAGGVLKLHDLITQATDKARERLREANLGDDLSAEAFEDIAHKVAIAALKFADLSNSRTTSYVFDLDRFMSFEGKTGPYLLYQSVRIRSLLRKAADQGAALAPITVVEPAERDLVLTLDAFDQAVSEAYDKRMPHLISEHTYRLAQSFSKFYAACPVLVAPDEATRGSRLTLAKAALDQLVIALGILGISTPERM